RQIGPAGLAEVAHELTALEQVACLFPVGLAALREFVERLAAPSGIGKDELARQLAAGGSGDGPLLHHKTVEPAIDGFVRVGALTARADEWHSRRRPLSDVRRLSTESA